jgi:D-alanyl-lipoteichoic acid acyltransferase DltB (MBOAT superfamily)
MCRQSFTSATFAGFWRSWNPLFSYYLLYYCYAPLRKRVPQPIALLAPFALSGLVHDLAATFARGEPYLVFTLTFTFLGFWTVLERRLSLRVTVFPVFVRPAYHLMLLAGCFWLSSQLLS